jgi:peroxiredoxin
VSAADPSLTTVRRWIVASGLCALTALGAPASGGSLTPAQLATLDLGAYPHRIAPPEFSLRTPDNQTVTLAGLRGRVVLLNFWASWCLECRPEMSAFEALHRKFAPRGLAIVGINTREDKTAVRQYATGLGLTFPLVLDLHGTTAVQYGVVGLPTTFLVGRDGRAVALAVGPREWASAAAEAIIQSLLSDSPGPTDPR